MTRLKFRTFRFVYCAGPYEVVKEDFEFEETTSMETVRKEFLDWLQKKTSAAYYPVNQGS